MISVIQCTPDSSLPMSIKAVNAAIATVAYRLRTRPPIRARSCIVAVGSAPADATREKPFKNADELAAISRIILSPR